MTASSRKLVRDRYSGGGAEYDRVRLETARGSMLTRHDLGIFRRLLPPSRAGGRVLEVGAGTGRFTLEALARGHRVIATDINAAQLETLRGKLAATGLEDRCEVCEADAFALPWAAGEFDLVFCIHVVPRFTTADDRTAAIAELARVVRPGGMLIFNYRNAWSPYNFGRWGTGSMPGRVSATLRAGGLRAEAVRTKHLLNGTMLDLLPRFLWKGIGGLDRACERLLPSLAWDVFVRARREEPA